VTVFAIVNESFKKGHRKTELYKMAT